MSVSAVEVIETWGLSIRGTTDLYIASNRVEYFDSLKETLLSFNIDYSSARSSRAIKAVIERLVTKEGMKGKGKHKGWKEQVEKEYKAMLISSYPQDQVANPSLNSKPIEYNKLIDLWGEYYYGKMYNGVIRDYANTSGHNINMKFCKEVLESSWIYTLQDIPKWAQNAIDEGHLTLV